MNIRRKLKPLYCRIKNLYFNKRYGMHIHPSARISRGQKIDTTYPQGVYIGEETFFAGGGILFTHDYSRAIHTQTYVGKRCFIGMNSIIMPGVKIGDECIIGTGAVVTHDVLLRGTPPASFELESIPANGGELLITA